MKVLIIEDDVLWQCKLQIIAERAGLNIAPLVSNIEDAEVFLKREMPDLIIADVHLGCENIFTLLSNKPYNNIPTILTTASENREDFLKSKKLINSAFLVKPFHHHTLLSTIKILLKKKIYDLDNNQSKNEIRAHSVEIKRFYKLLGDDRVIDLLNLQTTEAYILKQRWFELKTFAAIGKELNVTGQRIQRLYSSILEKIKSRTLSSMPKYKEYLELSKNKKNRLLIANNTTELKKKNIDLLSTNYDIKASIDNLEELNTKWKNVLWDKNIRTIENLLQYSKRELLMFNKLGKFAVLEIEKVLAERGFELKD